MRIIATAKTLLPALVILACSLLLIWPIVSTGQWYMAKQAYRFPYLMELFRDSFLAGHVYPRWLPELAGGYGYPTFIYYYPGFWFAALPYALLLAPVHTMYAALFTMLCVGGTGAYMLGRHLGLQKTNATAGALIFLLTLYVAKTIYFAGHLSELQSTLLCPWALLCYMRLTQKVEAHAPVMFAALWLSICLSAVFYSSLITGSWLFAALGILALEDVYRSKQRKQLIKVISIPFLLSIYLTAPYWFHLVTLRDFVPYERVAYLRNTFLPSIAQTINIDPIIGWGAIIGICLGRKQRYAPSVSILLAFMLWMMSSYASWIWHNIPFMTFMLSPTRIAPTLLSVELFGMILALRYLQEKNSALIKWLPIIPVILSLWFVLPHLKVTTEGAYRVYPELLASPVLKYDDFKQRAQQSFQDATHAQEFTPLSASNDHIRPRFLAHTPLAELLSGGIIHSQNGRGDDIEIMLEAPATIRINQLWFPGWSFTLDGQPLQNHHLELDKNGRMLITVDGHDSRKLHVWYDGPPHWLARNIVILLFIIVTVFFLYRQDQKQKNS